MTISPAASLGGVSLTVADLDAQVAFYEDAIGLREIRRDGDTVELGAPDGGATLVSLVERPDAPPRPSGTTGLFHLALLVPSRTELARALHGSRVPATGSRVRPITSSPRRCTSTIPRAMGSRSTVIVPVRSGPTKTAPSRWGRCRSISKACLPGSPRATRATAWPGHSDRPRPSPGRRHSRRGSVLRRCARLRTDGARLSGGALRLGGRLSPPRRSQYVGRSRSAGSPGGLTWPEELHDRVPGRPASSIAPSQRSSTRV